MREATRTQVRRAARPKPEKKLRVAAYCRVSTDSEEIPTGNMLVSMQMKDCPAPALRSG